jgi:hypothetical protein
MEVVPVFMEVLQTHTEEMPQDARLMFYSRVYKRLNEGMAKYGRPLLTNNGRDSLMDAWEEAIDGVQYLIQAYCEGRLSNPSLIHQQVKIALQIEQEILSNVMGSDMVPDDTKEATNGE